MSRHNIENIKAIFQLATLTERQNGRDWYPNALEIAETLSERYGFSGRLKAIGVIAALSPNKWERNIQDADALIAAYIAGGAEQARLTKVCTFGDISFAGNVELEKDCFLLVSSECSNFGDCLFQPAIYADQRLKYCASTCYEGREQR